MGYLLDLAFFAGVLVNTGCSIRRAGRLGS